MASSLATMRTIDRWKPRYLFFSGIAGGLRREGQVQGDLVMATEIWHYEYGKVVDGRFIPRLRFAYPVDQGLVNRATSYQTTTAEWKTCAASPPKEHHSPTLRFGLIGSGEKVIDDLGADLAAAVVKARPEIQAIEMEGAGASAAIETARSEGRAVGFAMFRGISDLPRLPGWRAFFYKLFQASSGAQTVERDSWKLYASAIAANFIARWLASPWGPELS